MNFGLATVAAYQGSDFLMLPDGSPTRRLLVEDKVPGTLVEDTEENPASGNTKEEMQPFLTLPSGKMAAPAQEVQKKVRFNVLLLSNGLFGKKIFKT